MCNTLNPKYIKPLFDPQISKVIANTPIKNHFRKLTFQLVSQRWEVTFQGQLNNILPEIKNFHLSCFGINLLQYGA